MSECNWDPSKHGGKPCPVHGAGGNSGAGGHKIRINAGKYETKLSDDSDWEEISDKEYNDLREGGYQDFDETVDDDFGFDEEDDEDVIDLDNKSIDITKEAERIASRVKQKEGEDFEDFEGRIWSEMHNAYSDTLDNDAIDEISHDLAEKFYKNSDEEPDESKRVKTGIDSQNRAYVQSSDGNRQYFASEKEAKDYANRMNEAQGLSEVIGGDDDNEGMLKDKTPLTEEESKNLDPNNPKYEGKSRSAITNAKLVDEGYEFTNANGEKVKESIIEYIPYGALQDGDNRKLYGIVRNYDGSDAPNTGAIVAPSLESAKEQLENQVKLGIQGSDRYLGRGKYDEEFFNIIRDNREEGDDEKYKERYGWDFNKPFKEHDFMKDDPYEKWKSERESAKNPKMTPEQRQQIRDQINKMVASLDDARSIDEAWDIEEGIKELEDMLKKFKGK